MAVDSVCNTNSAAIGSPARGAGGMARPAGIARLVSGSISISIASAGLMLAMMLVPAGVTAAEIGIVGDLEDRGRAIEDRRTALDVKGEHRRTDHDDKVMGAQGVRHMRRRGIEKARELRMPLWETAARRKRADPHRSLGLLRKTHHPIHRLGAIDAGADHKGRGLACRKLRGQCLHGVRIGAVLAAYAAGFHRLRRMVQSSIGTETNVGPQGGCIAT